MQHLKNGLDFFLAKNFDCIFPVVAFGYPVWRGVEITDEGKTQLVWPEYKNARSQDLRKVYHDAGQWYWLNMRKLNDTIFGPNTGAMVLSEEEAQDIDNLTDWKLAEMKYMALHHLNTSGLII